MAGHLKLEFLFSLEFSLEFKNIPASFNVGCNAVNPLLWVRCINVSDGQQVGK